MDQRRKMSTVGSRRYVAPALTAFAASLVLSAQMFFCRASADSGPASATAHSQSVELAVKAGFGKLEANSFSGNWVPFRVELSNTGESLSGRIVITTKSPPTPSSQVREFTKEIQLPAGAQQLHEIPVFLNSGEDALVVLAAGGQTLLETSLKVERSFQSDQLNVAVLDSDPTTLNFINAYEIVRAPNRDPFKFGPVPSQTTGSMPPPPPPQQQGSPSGPPTRRSRLWPGQQGPAARPIVIPPEELPRGYVCYDSLDAVVLGDAPLNQLSDEQFRSLKLWVASGGLLIITAASDFAGLRASALNDLSPVDPQGSITVPSVAELTDTYGRFESTDALSVMSSRLRPGARTLLGNDAQPIVAEKTYGSGAVRFVAFNPKVNPYRAWSAGKVLWSDVLLPAADDKSRQANWMMMGRRGGGNNSGVQNFVFRLADIQPASASYFLLFLLAYLLTVGPINYVVLRSLRRTELAWVTIPLVVFIFTAVSVSVAQLSRGGTPISADASLVEVHQPEGVSRVLSTVLIMPTSPGNERLVFMGDQAFANDSAGFANSGTPNAESIGYEKKADRFVVEVPMNTWKSNIFKLRSINEMVSPAISAHEEKQPGGPASLRIKSLSELPINRAVYVSAAGISPLLDLSPGEQQAVELVPPATLGSNTFNSWYLSMLGQDTQERDIYNDYSLALDREIGGQAVFEKGFFDTGVMQNLIPLLERPILIGFADTPALRFEFTGSIKRHSKSLYIIHL